MLSEIAVRQAKAKDKDYKLSDSEGLYLFVAKSGRRSWRLKYRFAGKERRLVLGVYPELSLKEARDRKCDARSTARVTACVDMPICCPSTSGPTPLLHHLRPSSPGVADAHRNMEAPLKPTENPNRKVRNFTLPLPGNFTVPLTP
jgi:hypothetical protein